MSEMSVAIHEISQTTQHAAVDAQKAQESAQTGGQTVQSTVETIGYLQSAIQQTSSRIEELGRSSDDIGRIIGVIDGIAGQTNLLALNAPSRQLAPANTGAVLPWLRVRYGGWPSAPATPPNRLARPYGPSSKARGRG